MNFTMLPYFLLDWVWEEWVYKQLSDFSPKPCLCSFADFSVLLLSDQQACFIHRNFKVDENCFHTFSIK